MFTCFLFNVNLEICTLGDFQHSLTRKYVKIYVTKISRYLDTNMKLSPEGTFSYWLFSKEGLFQKREWLYLLCSLLLTSNNVETYIFNYNGIALTAILCSRSISVRINHVLLWNRLTNMNENRVCLYMMAFLYSCT